MESQNQANLVNGINLAEKELEKASVILNEELNKRFAEVKKDFSETSDGKSDKPVFSLENLKKNPGLLLADFTRDEIFGKNISHDFIWQQLDKFSNQNLITLLRLCCIGAQGLTVPYYQLTLKALNNPSEIGMLMNAGMDSKYILKLNEAIVCQTYSVYTIILKNNNVLIKLDGITQQMSMMKFSKIKQEKENCFQPLLQLYAIFNVTQAKATSLQVVSFCDQLKIKNAKEIDLGKIKNEQKTLSTSTQMLISSLSLEKYFQTPSAYFDAIHLLEETCSNQLIEPQIIKRIIQELLHSLKSLQEITPESGFFSNLFGDSQETLQQQTLAAKFEEGIKSWLKDINSLVMQAVEKNQPLEKIKFTSAPTHINISSNTQPIPSNTGNIEDKLEILLKQQIQQRKNLLPPKKLIEVTPQQKSLEEKPTQTNQETFSFKSFLQNIFTSPTKNNVPTPSLLSPQLVKGLPKTPEDLKNRRHTISFSQPPLKTVNDGLIKNPPSKITKSLNPVKLPGLGETNSPKSASPVKNPVEKMSSNHNESKETQTNFTTSLNTILKTPRKQFSKESTKKSPSEPKNSESLEKPVKKTLPKEGLKLPPQRLPIKKDPEKNVDGNRVKNIQDKIGFGIKFNSTKN